jgi:hypothetical protein
MSVLADSIQQQQQRASHNPSHAIKTSSCNSWVHTPAAAICLQPAQVKEGLWSTVQQAGPTAAHLLISAASCRRLPWSTSTSRQALRQQQHSSNGINSSSSSSGSRMQGSQWLVCVNLPLSSGTGVPHCRQPTNQTVGGCSSKPFLQLEAHSRSPCLQRPQQQEQWSRPQQDMQWLSGRTHGAAREQPRLMACQQLPVRLQQLMQRQETVLLRLCGRLSTGVALPSGRQLQQRCGEPLWVVPALPLPNNQPCLQQQQDQQQDQQGQQQQK